MRLLKCGGKDEFSLTGDLHHYKVPPYAILSHTWGEPEAEVTYDDLTQKVGNYNSKAGYRKLKFCAKQATSDGLQHIWVDTCCINKSNFSELHEAINSMFRWYQEAKKCYVYLSDVVGGGEIALQRSRWFTRGWTLQELLAPRSVEFFDKNGNYLGDKYSLAPVISEITGIPTAALKGQALSSFSLETRMSWAQRRRTTRKEDEAYCLLGIFDVYMPLIYGEGVRAKDRLREEINKHEKLLRLEAEKSRVSEDMRRPARPRPDRYNGSSAPDHRVAPRMVLGERVQEPEEIQEGGSLLRRKVERFPSPEDARQPQQSHPDHYDRSGAPVLILTPRTLSEKPQARRFSPSELKPIGPVVRHSSINHPATFNSQRVQREDLREQVLLTLQATNVDRVAESDIRGRIEQDGDSIFFVFKGRQASLPTSALVSTSYKVPVSNVPTDYGDSDGDSYD